MLQKNLELKMKIHITWVVKKNVRKSFFNLFLDRREGEEEEDEEQQYGGQQARCASQ